MELHKNTKFENKYNISLNDTYLEYFYKAYQFVQDNYKEDYERIKNTDFNKITPDFFLREMAWCICVSGFNAKITSQFFSKLLEILNPMFNDIGSGHCSFWEDEYNLLKLREPLLRIFNNERKIDAILSNATKLIPLPRRGIDWNQYKKEKLSTPEKLQEFKMIGPVISLHLSRNLGNLNFVKPDLHLKRLAINWNFNTPLDLCLAIQNEIGGEASPLGLIDLCLFYAASTFGTK